MDHPSNAGEDPDQDLVNLLRHHLLGLGSSDKLTSAAAAADGKTPLPNTTGVLRDAEFIADNSSDVHIDMIGTQNVAAKVWLALKGKPLPDQAGWLANGLHPSVKDAMAWKIAKPAVKEEDEEEEAPNSDKVVEAEEVSGGKEEGGEEAASWVVVEEKEKVAQRQSQDEDRKLQTKEPRDDEEEVEVMVDMQESERRVLEFVFTMDLLNFCFWSEKDESDQEEQTESKDKTQFAVYYNGGKWTGYWSLVAAMRRAWDKGVPISSPSFWQSSDFTLAKFQNVFRSDSNVDLSFLEARYGILKDSAEVLRKEFEMDVAKIVSQANGSAAVLVNLLADKFPAFQDEATFEGRKVRFYKRAQILAADLWAAFNGTGFGKFSDIDHLTMFPDYRVPQQLRDFGALVYNPSLESHIHKKLPIEPGHPWEVQIRGCSIWCVELIRRHIVASCPNAKVNAVAIDFFLYDLAKELERSGAPVSNHHRTRSIWY